MATISRRTFGQGVAGAAALTAVAPALGAQGAAAAEGAAGSTYLIGTGVYDITGAVAETGAFGYAANQTMTGLHQRLYARAFVFGDPAGPSRAVFVSVDLGAMFQSITLAVSAELVRRYGGVYHHGNTILSATHTHVGCSGQSHDRLYQIAGNDGAGYGYDRHNFAAVVDGIVNAVARAHESLAPGTITLQTGRLTGATKNRSTRAYQANPDAGDYDSDVNDTVTQLVLRGLDGTPRGLINWFAIHPTSFSLKSTLVSGDNKGYAQYFVEREMGSRPTDEGGFVAAFAQCDEGDTVSTQGNAFSAPGYQGDPDEFVNAEVDGRRQVAKALELYAGPGTPLSGPIDMRSRWVDFGRYTVGARWTGGTDERLPTPARGWSFACGAENGPSNLPGIHEGMTKGSFSVTRAGDGLKDSPEGSLVRFAFLALNTIAMTDDPAQGAKPVLLPTGKWGWAPLQMPVQVLRLGSLAIVSVPGEATTMAGRRIRRVVLDALAGTGVTHAVIAGLANQYTGYITTREEYATQQYEGASTEFGPHELGAFLQEYDALATALRTGAPVTGITPRDSGLTAGTRPGVVLDDVPPGEAFGQVLTQPAAAYGVGDVARATFRGGHPKNDFRTMRTFVKVQRQDGGAWVDVLDDHDWDTTYEWAREGASWSRCTVTWRIRQGTAPGTYRLVQLGDWKNGWNGRVSPYVGTSRPFAVR